MTQKNAKIAERIHEHVEQTVASLVPQIKVNIAELVHPRSQERNHEAFLTPQIKAKLVEVFQAVIQERIHEPGLPRSAVVGSGKEGIPGRDCEEELVEAAMARTREEDEFLEAVPQDETLKVRQAEVHFRKHREKLEELMRSE